MQVTGSINSPTSKIEEPKPISRGTLSSFFRKRKPGPIGRSSLYSKPSGPITFSKEEIEEFEKNLQKVRESGQLSSGHGRKLNKSRNSKKYLNKTRKARKTRRVKKLNGRKH